MNLEEYLRDLLEEEFRWEFVLLRAESPLCSRLRDMENLLEAIRELSKEKESP